MVEHLVLDSHFILGLEIGRLLASKGQGIHLSPPEPPASSSTQVHQIGVNGDGLDLDFEVGHLHSVPVLVARDHLDGGRPVAVAAPLPLHSQSALVDIHIGFRLEPTGQPSAGRPSHAVNKVAQKQPLIGVAAERYIETSYRDIKMLNFPGEGIGTKKNLLYTEV